LNATPWDCCHKWMTFEQVAAFFITDPQIVKNIVYNKAPELFTEKRFIDRNGTFLRILSFERDVRNLAPFFRQYVKEKLQ
jgi:hypothetical protein